MGRFAKFNMFVNSNVSKLCHHVQNRDYILFDFCNYPIATFVLFCFFFAILINKPKVAIVWYYQECCGQLKQKHTCKQNIHLLLQVNVYG